LAGFFLYPFYFILFRLCLLLTAFYLLPLPTFFFAFAFSYAFFSAFQP
jgi:hypothetical protein